ncbi:MAG: efflux transporter periplasmic adaptor subunit [Micavibrio aeruginosavorus]|uniref:Efflux transporter periplasmic adaptor subunit n=1 Tax=Micavibrio aeruginosavorus TaxID=349221 RepID=A0A2W5PNP5_9BACT|nr:MAG: efflux transporter periplasmic adaptor subunit [Micavibrio aeruginosavorus]
MSRPAKKKLLLSVMALALIGGGFAAVNMMHADNASAQMPGNMPPMPVPVVTVEEKPVQIWKEFSGRLAAVDYVEIRPQVSGLIEKIHFEDGQIVNKGDILYSIDPRPYEAAVAQARADVAAAKDDADYAQKELARAEELLKTGAISKQGYDERVNSQRVNKSNSAAANARLKAALVDLDHTTIEAPISGRISRPEITEGNLVSASSAPLLTTIVSNQGIYADFEVDEQTYLGFVRGGSSQSLDQEKEVPVRLFLNSDKTKSYDGVIKSFDNRLNTSSGTIRVRAIFANEDGALLPGMFSRVQLGSSGTENHLTVPDKAINTDQNKKFVYIVDDKNAATYKEVKLGDVVGVNRIITDGLNSGDKVIIDGFMKLRPGATVDPKTPEEMAAMSQQQTQAAQKPAEAKPESAPPKDKEPATQE